uniref:Actin cytoskeleton-regulatory complex protein END3 n=1 Tax=Coccidioides posadasii RMSCC 3488 TaxID=454284 RepID=A0A0J6FEJ5_COCPO|nr:EF hand domain-containing protein [Coccidioides posadasii RMSCC 3488]
MAEAAGLHPNLNLTPEEKRVFYQLFQTADKTNLGVVTGEVAVSFFEKTNLPAETLGLIWQIADKQNRGLLTPSGFGIVLRLIGHAQAGRAPTEELAYQPGPLPKFTGITTEPPPPASAGSPPPALGPTRVPPLNQEDIAKFSSLFERSDTQNGLISGETAKQIFERARLPNEILGRIWNLADTKQRGALDITEFIIAMHLLTAFKMGTMRTVPQSLPPGLYDAACRRGDVRTSVGSRSSDVPPVPAIPKQFTGSAPHRTQSPLNRQPMSPLSAHGTGSDWLITPQEKSHFDSIFNTVDKRKVGFLSGDDAVGFFANAQLSEETLAQIWDLADIDSDGQLSKDEFAVAMYLVRQQRTTREPLPQSLPPALVPPSMRRQSAPPPQPIQPQTTGARSAAEDLFGLDVFTAPLQTSQSTGGSNPSFQSPSSPMRPPPPANVFKPFVPSSSFGQSLTPHATGLSSTSAQPRSPQPSDDLLGDADPEESKKLTQETTELANLSNQVSTLSREMENVQAKRGNAEQDLAQTNRQKRDFETRLAQARAMYEQEVKSFKALEEQLAASKAETKKLQQDFAMVDGSRQDLQNQFNQVSAALEADQRENATLKEKIRLVNAQISQVKPQLEKARSEARQQKGLAAINKKQLAAVEGERDRIQEEINSMGKEIQESERQTSPPPVTSPAASNASQGTNPFFKRTPSASTDQALSANHTGGDGQNTAQNIFDNMFGAAFSAPSKTSPPPPTTFRTEASTPQPQSADVVTASTTHEGQSPSTTFDHVPDAVEPPPPPRSRQLTPNELPIEGHKESQSTSVKTSPPGSRFGDDLQAGAAAPPSNSKETSPFESGDPFSENVNKKKSLENEGLAQNETQSTIPGAFPAATSPQRPSKKDFTFDELFAGRTHERSQSQKALDFEEAFAAMKKDPKKDSANEAQMAGGSNEFPPIRELEDDDDSTDSEAPAGFDDDFTPISPPRGNGTKEIQPFPPNEATPLPGADAQPSPPGYDGSASKQPTGTAPPEFGDLLPGRTDPTAPGDAPHSIDATTGAPIIGGVSKAPADFEAAFAGLDLTPAKEAEDDDDDEDDFESPFNKDPSNFDMTFDSPGPSKSNAAADAPNINDSANANFFSFNSAGGSSSGDGKQPVTQQNASSLSQQPSSHDWDALFSVLDEAKGQGGVGKSEANFSTSAPPTSTEPSQATVPTTASPTGQSKQPGWALNADSGEDDLILQRLTSMGYPRDESLAALEKFDYNLDKAADFLASKS